ncbi:MAG: TetR/AcrR family transcriptional regulator [Tissierellia bacterium]|nr:TetR/AcrR family transcriptional regulator [Tissierellia bacterium]MDD3227012.1 TetR/AcrR family transcriptional regulator [Tissierellia bacterium]MDD3751117.1 TetR/AcrR family transcriptional regulator [Tissierellia bacterium]MDD4046625.1 TetR/AcrR family transcriptional regulator [Tissierellia bacterium]MDD4678536.1 TetR/AcrR family transcriptional regulator [Tissierellia bacterium]
MDKQIRTRMNREDRRKQILNSALDVFVEKGYNGTTTQDIAKSSNVSEVTLFRYFSSKQEIYMEAIEPIIITTLEDSIDSTKDLEPKEKLRNIIIERIRLISKYHKVVRLILMENQVNPELGDLNYIKRISDLLKNSIDKMGVKFTNNEFTLRFLMGSILSFLYLPESNEGYIDQFVNNIIENIKIEGANNG